jgi:hypothetical protein
VTLFRIICTPGEHLICNDQMHASKADATRASHGPRLRGGRSSSALRPLLAGCASERASAGRKKHFLPLRTKEVDGIARGSVSYTERARSTLFAQAPYYYLLSSKPLDSRNRYTVCDFFASLAGCCEYISWVRCGGGCGEQER